MSLLPSNRNFINLINLLNQIIGAVIALLTGITSERKLAGILALSGFLGLSHKISSMTTDHASKLPIFWGHGNADAVVQYKWGVASIQKLKEMKFSGIEFNTYKGKLL